MLGRTLLLAHKIPGRSYVPWSVGTGLSFGDYEPYLLLYSPHSKVLVIEQIRTRSLPFKDPQCLKMMLNTCNHTTLQLQYRDPFSNPPGLDMAIQNVFGGTLAAITRTSGYGLYRTNSTCYGKYNRYFLIRILY